MGFFYQAIKRATGQEDAGPQENGPTEIGLALDEAVEAAAGAPEAVPQFTGQATARARSRLSLNYKLEKLVAVLSPPVLEGHVAAMEECRLIRSRIRETMRSRKLKSLMLTSCSAGEGKTLLATNLAFALSQLDKTRVLLIDADLRRPSIANFLGEHGPYGLSSYLAERKSFDEVCCEVSNTLHVITTEQLAENSAELLQGDRMHTLLLEAAAQYDIVLLDAPPLFPIADAQVLLPMVDAAALILRSGATSFELATEAAELLKGKCIGTILNFASKMTKHSYYSYSSYKASGAANRS